MLTSSIVIISVKMIEFSQIYFKAIVTATFIMTIHVLMYYTNTFIVFKTQPD